MAIPHYHKGECARSVNLRSVNMGGEDFAHYLGVTKKGGAFFRLGARTTDGAQFPAHSSKFDVNEDSLLIGCLLFAHLIALEC